MSHEEIDRGDRPASAGVSGYARGPQEGEALWVTGGLYTYKAVGSENGGAYTLVEVHGRHGLATPRHLHEREDEGFYVVEGDITLIVGDESFRMAAGAFGFAPRGVAHAFRLDSAEARLLLLITPGAAGHEDLFRGIGVPAASRVIPPTSDGPPDVAHLAEVAARHGTRVVGPPP